MTSRAILLALLLSPLVCEAQTPSLLANGGFEEAPRNLRLPGWRDGGSPGSPAYTYRKQSCRTGSCVAVEDTLAQVISISDVNDRIVALQAWLRGDASEKSSAGPAGARIQMWVLLKDGREDVFDARPISKGDSTAWIEYEVVAYVPPDAVSMRVFLDGRRSGGVWVDDASLRTIDSGTLPGRRLPDTIQRWYGELDRACATRAFEQSERVLVKRPPAAAVESMPLRSRVAGLRNLTEGAASLSCSTVFQRRDVTRDDIVMVLAQTSVRRSGASVEYRYELFYRDVWVRTGTTWQLLDRSPRLQDARVVLAQLPTDAPAEGSPGGVACGLQSSLKPSLLGLGPTDYSRALMPRGKITAALLFVDFVGDAGTEAFASDIWNRVLQPGLRWFDQEAQGRLRLDVTRVEPWIHLARGAGSYIVNDGEVRTIFYDDVVNAAAATGVDFSLYDFVFIVPVNLDTVSRARNLLAGEGVRVNRAEVRHFQVLVGGPQVTPGTFIHETSHLFGLPDLYEKDVMDSDQMRTVGSWDVMSSGGYKDVHMTAWSRHKLGWVRESQIECLTSHQSTTTLTPVSVPGGTKAVVIPVSTSRAYVVEAREAAGTDADLCGEGLLIYSIDTAIASAQGPMNVLGGTSTLGIPALGCGGRYDAIMSLRPREKRMFPIEGGGAVTIQLEARTLGSFTVTVSR